MGGVKESVSAWETSSATWAPIARCAVGVRSRTVAPLRVIRRTEYGSVCLPSAAKVA